MKNKDINPFDIISLLDFYLEAIYDHYYRMKRRGKKTRFKGSYHDLEKFNITMYKLKIVR